MQAKKNLFSFAFIGKLRGKICGGAKRRCSSAGECSAIFRSIGPDSSLLKNQGLFLADKNT